MRNASLGKLATPSARGGSKFGIQAKLQTAFGAAALLTVVASGIALLSFAAIQRAVGDLVGRQVPEMTDTLRLSTISAQVSTAAARLVSASSPAALRAISDTIDDTIKQQETLVKHLRETNKDSAASTEIDAVSQQLNVNLRELKTVIFERQEIETRFKTQMDAVHRVHAKITDQLAPIVDDSYFDVVMALERAGRNAAQIVGNNTSPGGHDQPADDAISGKVLE